VFRVPDGTEVRSCPSCQAIMQTTELKTSQDYRNSLHAKANLGTKGQFPAEFHTLKLSFAKPRFKSKFRRPVLVDFLRKIPKKSRGERQHLKSKLMRRKVCSIHVDLLSFILRRV